MPHRPSTKLGDWKQRLWSSSQGNLLKQTNTTTAMPGTKDTFVPNETKFSTLVGGTISGPRGTVQRKAQALRARQLAPGGEFKVGEIEASSGKLSVSSLKGIQRNSEVIYVGTFSSNGDVLKRGKIADVFDVHEEIDEEANSDTEEGRDSFQSNGSRPMARSFSQPDFLAGNGEQVSEEVMLQRPSGLFDRPMLGSLAFRFVFFNLCFN